MRTLYVTYVLSAAAVQSVLGRPSFFQNSGWELVEDEPTLRVETTKHDWGSKDVSITKSEFYETKDGELELELHGSASGHRDEADVQLDYQLLQDTWLATAQSNGDSASGKIEHKKGITANALSGSATGAGNTAATYLESGIDECDPDVDVNCFAGTFMLIEGIDLEGEMEVTQEYEADDGATAATVGTMTVETPPGNNQDSQGAGLGISVISFIPTLDAGVTVDTEGLGNIIITSDASTTVFP